MDDKRSPCAARDLVARMTLEEKGGLMMHGTARSVGAVGVAGTGTTPTILFIRSASAWTMLPEVSNTMTG
jgi:hypothetical protein